MHGLGLARPAVLTRADLPPALPPDLPEQVSRALREDIGASDVTAADPAGTQALALCRGALR